MLVTKISSKVKLDNGWLEIATEDLECCINLQLDQLVSTEIKMLDTYYGLRLTLKNSTQLTVKSDNRTEVYQIMNLINELKRKLSNRGQL